MTSRFLVLNKKINYFMFYLHVILIETSFDCQQILAQQQWQWIEAAEAHGSRNTHKIHFHYSRHILFVEPFDIALIFYASLMALESISNGIFAP